MKNEDGFALVLSFFIIIVLTIFITSLYSLVITEQRQSIDLQHNIQAHYYARSGVEFVMANSQIIVDRIDDNNGKYAFAIKGNEDNRIQSNFNMEFKPLLQISTVN